MTPSPGRIHQLPVKVLYSLEGGSQSYLTVLSDTQDVYIHPGHPEYGSDDEPGPIGSTYLKSVAQGVCYASPECAPSSSLDFSVYNLDPLPRLRPTSQPFASTSTSHQNPHQSDEASWSGKGFLSWAMAESASGSTLIKGRLMKEYDFEPTRFSQEGGLEALMRAGGSGGDGRGWGLEVVISLKLVNPGGKGEFSGRQAFERMLFSGNGQASGSVLVATSPLRTAVAPPSPSFRPPPSSANNRIPGSTPPVHSGGQVPTPRPPASSIGPASTAPARPPLPPARSSGSTLPPNSMPMAPSSSQSGPSRPPSTSGTARQPYRPPAAPSSQQASSARESSAPAPAPAAPRANANHPPSTSLASNHPSSSASNHSTPNGKHQHQQPIPGPPPGSRHSRQVTPPPLPRPKSPPPTTPHRRALRDLLQADGKMSPSLAKELVNNPSLLALLKSFPSAARSPGHAEGSKGVKAEDSRSTRDETPTPTGPKTGGPVAKQDGCSNCGTTETTMWRSKVYPDGTQTKVCDDCGIYFNKNKRMRPKELWASQASDGPSKRAKSTSANPTPPPAGPGGVRQSPRLTRNTGSNGSPTNNGGPASAPPIPSIQESPSKRRRSSKPIPQPSPRMATRSSARSDSGASGSGKMDPFPFSVPPPPPQGQGQTGMEDIDLDALLAQLTGTHAESNVNGQTAANGGGLGQGFNLEDLFASVDNAAATDDALAEDMMKFLAGLENDVDQQGGGSGQP